ncbi:hypothetical protein ACIOFV_35140 [Streptomyces mirabilis]|uniref:hypothetical protein n=1 Tax=Streptomyces mirabilis TaxID=68239 RepID=UPI0037F31669
MAAELLDARWPGLGPSVRRRLLAEAAGNPLALREPPSAPSGRQRSGRDQLPALQPLSVRLEAASPLLSKGCLRRPDGCCSWPRSTPTPA